MFCAGLAFRARVPFIRRIHNARALRRRLDERVLGPFSRRRLPVCTRCCFVHVDVDWRVADVFPFLLLLSLLLIVVVVVDPWCCWGCCDVGYAGFCTRGQRVHGRLCIETYAFACYLSFRVFLCLLSLPCFVTLFVGVSGVSFVFLVKKHLRSQALDYVSARMRISSARQQRRVCLRCVVTSLFLAASLCAIPSFGKRAVCK